jgi:Cu+-exporting ATPase
MDELLRVAAALEAGSTHPLARAVRERAAEAGVAVPAVDDFADVPGHGVRGTVDGHAVALGAPRWVAELGVCRSIPCSTRRRARRRPTGRPWSAWPRGRTLGWLALADRLRVGAREAVAQLAALGVHAHADRRQPPHCRAIAREAGIADFTAEVLPQDKAAEVRRLQQAHRARWDGRRRHQRRAGAGCGRCRRPSVPAPTWPSKRPMVLVGSDLRGVATAIVARHRAQDPPEPVFAFVYNVLGIPLAAFGLLNPVLAGAAMALSSVSVVSNCCC